MCSGNDQKANLAEAGRLVRLAAAEGADWIQLPEIFSYNGPYSELYKNGEREGGDLERWFSDLSAELKICLFAGSIGEHADNCEEDHQGMQRVYNTLYVYNRGQKVGKYRKTHLFNLQDSSGKNIYCESDGFLSGDSINIIDIDGVRVGLGICYDLRFSGFFNKMTEYGAVDVIALPSAFTRNTGMDHWEVMLRARAIEYQCYVFAANQCGTSAPGKSCYGHSMVIDPWGHKIADTGDQPGFASGFFSRDRLIQVRKSLPSLDNRRPELY